MRLRSIPGYILIAVFFVAFAALWYAASQSRMSLGQPALLSGWVLFVTLVVLALFNQRKKLSMVPLGRASVWLNVHVVGGMFALGIYFVHTETLWPMGLYERLLALLFYLVSVSGIVGLLLERTFPRRLNQIGYEVIYERIPDEIRRLRESAEEAAVAAAAESGSESIPRVYLDTLLHYFARPRFFWSHVFGGDKSEHWVRHQTAAVDRYLNDTERKYLEQIQQLALVKDKVDRHYALQTVLKFWLFLHLPLAVGVMALAIWHLLLVHVYAL